MGVLLGYVKLVSNACDSGIIKFDPVFEKFLINSIVRACYFSNVSILLAYCGYFLLNDFKPRLALPKDPDQYRDTKTGKKGRMLLFSLNIPSSFYNNNVNRL